MNDLIKRARMQLSVRHPFWGTILLNCKVIEDGSIKSLAATNGLDLIKINPSLVKGLDLTTMKGLFLHEALHIALLTGARQERRRHDIWNVATDIVINLMVLDMGYKLPKGGHIRPEFATLSAEKVYDRLLEESQAENGETRPGTGEDQGNSASGTTEGNSSVATNPPLDTHLPFPVGREQEGKNLIIQANEVYKMRTPDRGFLPKGLLFFIEDLMTNKVPWQRIFMRYLGETLAREEYSFYPCNRRYMADDVYLPSLRSHKVGQVVLSIDTSGSVLDTVKEFAAEANGILREVDDITIITSDAKVQQVIPAREARSFLLKLDFKGGGGTDHRPVFEYLEKNRITPDLFIGLTDGCSSFPKKPPRFPILWGLTPEHSIPPFGKSVVIKD